MPESTMAIVTPAPVATCQAEGAPIIWRFHCSPKAGSFGVVGVAPAGAPNSNGAAIATTSAPQRVTLDFTRPFSTIGTPRHPSGVPLFLQAAQDGDDLAEDHGVGRVQFDRLQPGVG